MKDELKVIVAVELLIDAMASLRVPIPVSAPLVTTNGCCVLGDTHNERQDTTANSNPNDNLLIDSPGLTLTVFIKEIPSRVCVTIVVVVARCLCQKPRNKKEETRRERRNKKKKEQEKERQEEEEEGRRRKEEKRERRNSKEERIELDESSPQRNSMHTEDYT